MLIGTGSKSTFEAIIPGFRLHFAPLTQKKGKLVPVR